MERAGLCLEPRNVVTVPAWGHGLGLFANPYKCCGDERRHNKVGLEEKAPVVI